MDSQILTAFTIIQLDVRLGDAAILTLNVRVLQMQPFQGKKGMPDSLPRMLYRAIHLQPFQGKKGMPDSLPRMLYRAIHL